MPSAPSAGRRVVLVGAGHAHLHTLKRGAGITGRGHEFVVVAPDVFWYSGLATGMLGGRYPPRLDQIDVAALTAQGGGRFVQDSVLAIEPAARLIRLERSPPLHYDLLSLTLGSEPPPLRGAAGHPACYTVKPIRRLFELRQDLERHFAASPGTALRVVIAGGGVTGCELAANVLALAAARGGQVDVVVLAGTSGILGRMPEAARQVVREALHRRGAVFRTDARVERIEGREAVLEGGGRVRFDRFLNATGLLPHPLLRRTGLPVDADGALLVDRHLRSVADPRILGAGDCIAFQGRELPKIGVYAIRQAPILFRNLLAALDGSEPAGFEPQRHFLWIMNLGDGTGLAVRERLWWHGRLAFWLKDRIDRRFLREYQKAAGSGRSAAGPTLPPARKDGRA